MAMPGWQPAQGLGGDLLLAAGAGGLAAAAEVGGIALAIDATDGTAARWGCSTIHRN